MQVFRADHAVDEADREVEPVGVLQHAGELFSGGVHGNLGGLRQPVAHQTDGFPGQSLGLGYVGTARRGRFGDRLSGEDTGLR
ncbi:hypothetical protein D9M72_440740 [compost metagenome]